jgi:cytochrome b involved in lipid metabolism
MNIKVVGLLGVVILVIGGVVLFGKSNNRVQPETKPVQVVEEKKGYSLADVAEHATEANCWMAIEGKVYNVTEFVSKHPGGKAILGGCGKDATVLFNERPTNNKGPHPDAAKQALVQLYIGELQ